jgi:hypothetical protein
MRTLILVSFLSSVATLAVAQSSPPLNTDDEKSIYLIGASLGRNVAQFDLNEVEIEIMKRGLEDSIRDRDLAVDVEAFGPKVNEFVDRRNARTAKLEQASSTKMLDAAS